MLDSVLSADSCVGAFQVSLGDTPVAFDDGRNRSSNSLSDQNIVPEDQNEGENWRSALMLSASDDLVTVQC